jgi:trans-aconitate methyltransferase
MDSKSSSDSQTTLQNQWDAELYDSKHSFVSHFGADLLELLAPRSGECILDLGCGTGHLTYKIATSGAEVLGIDNASTMIEQARKNYPHLNFEVADGKNLHFTEQFDAVFSNAVLHWIKAPEKVVAGVWRSLKPGGRFVAEFGGKGNVKAIVSVIYNAIQAAGYPANALNPWYFPSIGEYGTLLEKQGFQLTFAILFDRPTPLNDGEQGMQNWLEMFGNSLFQAIPVDKQMSILADIEKQLRPSLYHNGTWFADYRRIRVIAIKD